jgi:Ser/Thr protein kinase RdoA (MazF antagonist)
MSALGQDKIVAILVDRELIGACLQTEYELGEVDTVSVLVPSEPDRDDLFKIEASGKSYALKLQAPHKKESQFVLEARMFLWLQQSGCALVPPVMLARSGDPCGVVKERPSILTKFISASPVYDWREATWGDALALHGGEALARLHNHLSGLSIEEMKTWGYDVADAPPSLANRGRVGVGSVRSRIHNWLESAIADFCSRNAATLADHSERTIAAESQQLDQTVCRVLLDRKQRWMSLLDDSEAHLQRFPQAEKTVMIHGDFHPGNALWDEEKVLAIIDFENSHLEHPLYDVAYSIIMFSSRWHRAVAFRSGPFGSHLSHSSDMPSFSRALAGKFLNGYLSQSQLISEKDCRELLPSYLQIAGSVILYWMLIEHQSKTSYRNLIEFLLVNLEGVSNLAVI